MSEKIELTEKEKETIETVTKLHPEADGVLEAIDDAAREMFYVLIKKTGTEFDKMEVLYRELMELLEKVRNYPHLVLEPVN